MTDPVVLLSTGDVIGPNSSTDGTLVLFDGTSGKKVKGNNAVVTAQGLNLLDDVDPASNRATIGLDQVNNTSDMNKPVSTLQQTALDLKFDKVGGTITGTANFASGSGDSPKVSWTTPFASAFMNVYNDYVRVEATLNGTTLPTPLLLNLTSKSFSVFGRTVWDTGNFTPPVKSTASLATNGWSKDGDTGVIEQWMEVAMGDYATVNTLAVTWPFQFPNQFFNARVSFRMPNSTIGCASQASYSAATTSGCTLRIEEWTGAVQTGLVLVIEARGF